MTAFNATPNNNPGSGAAQPQQQQPLKSEPVNNSLSVTNEAPASSWVPKVFAGVAIVAAFAGWMYQSSQLSVVRNELAHSRDQMSELHKQVDTASAEAEAKLNESIAKMNQQIADAKKEAEVTVVRTQNVRAAQANKTLTALTQRNEELVKQIDDIKKENQEAQEKSAQVAEKLSGVEGQIGDVKTEVANNRNTLDETRTDLKRAMGDMGVMSGLIATNSTELAALRKLGERDYIEFTLPRTGAPQKIGDVQLALKKTDLKRNRFTFDVLADDRRVEKKDKTINEPVQFYISKARQPYEVVINSVSKDKVSGYLAVPKAKLMAQR